MRTAASGPLAVFVKNLLAFGQALDDRVDWHIAGPGIKSEHILQRSCSGQNRYVTDTTDIVDDSTACRIAKQQVMSIGHQGSPLTARRHVAWAEVSYRHNPGALGNHSRLPQLQRGAYSVPPQGEGLRQV